jgi:ATP-dependent Lhr-like helicase
VQDEKGQLLTQIFHPIVQKWFDHKFGRPTPPQEQVWPRVAANESVLLAAPTGSGKTMAAFLVCIDRLVRQAVTGTLENSVQIVYVSPLRALSNDIQRNLEVPLEEIRAVAAEMGIDLPEIRAFVRTGDSSSADRAKILRNPPHILVTTPESLYLLVTSDKGRGILQSSTTVIVDEIHALARDKRGTHLVLSLERLDQLCGRRLQRIGLSATQRPLDQIANFLVGAQVDGQPRPCSIIDVGMMRDLDLGLITSPSDLTPVCSHDQWDEIYNLLVDQIQTHKSTVVFVNTRKLAERVTFRLTELLGESMVACHHGSLAKNTRHDAEQRLKRGELKAIVATASLELGIDIGFIESVCQIGSPRNIAAFLQRVGRSGHSLGLTPKGRLFPLTQDELIECMALIRAVRLGSLDTIIIPEAPADILIQQVIAAAASRQWHDQELFEVLKGAWPYRSLTRDQFDELLGIAAEGVAKNKKNGAYVYWDRINGTIKPRRSARIAALTSGGAIPDLAEYRVVTADGTFIGTLDEEFSIESSPGDVFLLGNNSWMIEYVRGGQVVVHDAGGSPPSVPFWQGEGLGRSFELSAEVSQLREEIASRIDSTAFEHKAERGEVILAEDEKRALVEANRWLSEAVNASSHQATQASRFIAAQLAATGVIPSAKQIVFERFFDETGGMQLVVHAPFGMRITKAWGLAMRKRYCRRFDFELQATANDNGFVLAMGPQDGFQLESMFQMINSGNARPLLQQALLQIPLFPVRWRWNLGRSLGMLRMNGGKKVPPHLQRFRAEDLLTAVFPQSTQCVEHIQGDIEFPSHPLIQQTLKDCLTEALDIDRFEGVLRGIESGEIKLAACDTREPSPFSYGLINAGPYAFLDDAPLEERRARAVQTRRSLTIETVRDLAMLDGQAIAVVREECRPTIRDPDELHDVLMQLGRLTASEFSEYESVFAALQQAGRAFRFAGINGQEIWAATERWPLLHAAYAGALHLPEVELPERLRAEVDPSAAAQELLKGRLEIIGPRTAAHLSEDLDLSQAVVEANLPVLESIGVAISGKFTPGADTIEWCDRRILSRIHRLTIEGLRQKIKPVEVSVFYRFLIHHQRVALDRRAESSEGLLDVIHQLQGLEVPIGAWENELLAIRTKNYQESVLDQLCYAGKVAWGRLRPVRDPHHNPLALATPERRTILHKSICMGLFVRSDRGFINDQPELKAEEFQGGREALRLVETLKDCGALFYDDLVKRSKLLRSQVEEGLRELVGRGWVVSDGFDGLRQLARAPTAGSSREMSRFSPSGRWTLVEGAIEQPDFEEQVRFWAWQLLQRYGVVFRDLLQREDFAPLWGVLSRFYRRLEAQGQVRGGRFVAGVSGEQFALPEAVDQLRTLRDQPEDSTWFVISAVDPLNLVGIITKDERVAAVRRNKIVIRGGKLFATYIEGELKFTEEVDPSFAEVVRRAVQLNGLVRQKDPFTQNGLSLPVLGARRSDRHQFFRKLQLVREE